MKINFNIAAYNKLSGVELYKSKVFSETLQNWAEIQQSQRDSGQP